MWEQLFQELTNDTPDRQRPAFRPSLADFDGFEVMRDFNLPQSYREYAAVFGPGLLARFFHIGVPGCPALGMLADLALLDEDSPSHAPVAFLGEVHEGGDVAQLKRMMFFCATEGSDTIGWDPTEMTDRAGPEYAIYFVPRIGPQVPVANSFPEFITEVCLGSRLAERANFALEEWGTPYRRVFRPG